MSLRATVPPASADTGAAVASVAAGAAVGSDALVGAPAGGWLLQAASSTIRSSVPNHRLRILVFLSAKKLGWFGGSTFLQETSLALRELPWEINTPQVVIKASQNLLSKAVYSPFDKKAGLFKTVLLSKRQLATWTSIEEQLFSRLFLGLL
jgi:hypothetical protein